MAAQRSALTVLCVVVVALKKHLIIMWFGEEVSCNKTWPAQRSSVIFFARSRTLTPGPIKACRFIRPGQCRPRAV